MKTLTQILILLLAFQAFSQESQQQQQQQQQRKQNPKQFSEKKSDLIKNLPSKKMNENTFSINRKNKWSISDIYYYNSVYLDDITFGEWNSRNSNLLSKSITSQRNIWRVENTYYDLVSEKLVQQLGLDDDKTSPDTVISDVGTIKDFRKMYTLYEALDRKIKEKRQNESVNTLLLLDNQKILSKQLNIVLENDFVDYRYNPTSKTVLKGVNIYHDNDFFLYRINEDMNYTGGGRLELFTDYFKMRVFKRANRTDLLSYQGVFYGAEAYTPFIRFTKEQQAKRDSVYKYDRPFGSYQYYGRAKYRLRFDGLYRTKGEFRIGKIGANVTNTVQSALHRDLTTNSVKPIGWENQIANGGRLAFNIQESVDYMILSKDNCFIRKMKSDRNSYAYKRNLNIFGTLEGNYGQVITSAGFGFGISNRSFTERNAQDVIKINGKSFFKGGLFWEVRANYKRVIHNTMLEGFGITSTSESDNDGYDDEPLSKHTSVPNRNLFNLQANFSFRINKVSVFYKMNYLTKEFEWDSKAKEEYKLNNPAIYGWGTLGFHFLL